jgi:hypothetical protein
MNKTQRFNFESKSIEFWKAQTRHLNSHEDIVRWFEREHGISKSRAIVAARRTNGHLYNLSMERRARPVSLGLQQMVRRSTSAPVTALSFRTRDGRPLIRFQGL